MCSAWLQAWSPAAKLSHVGMKTVCTYCQASKVKLLSTEMTGLRLRVQSFVCSRWGLTESSSLEPRRLASNLLRSGTHSQNCWQEIRCPYCFVKYQQYLRAWRWSSGVQHLPCIPKLLGSNLPPWPRERGDCGKGHSRSWVLAFLHEYHTAI